MQIIDTKTEDPYFRDNPQYYHPSTLFRASNWDKYINQNLMDFKKTGGNVYEYPGKHESEQILAEANKRFREEIAKRSAADKDRPDT